MESHSQMDLAAEVVSAFVSKNAVPRGELPALIETVHTALVRLGAGEVVPPPDVARQPAVSVRKSITPDFLVCLEDGRKLKSLKRHLAHLGLTPERYREKWKLPFDYPMVAPNYAAARSALAKQMGLGQMRKATRKRGRPTKKVGV